MGAKGNALFVVGVAIVLALVGIGYSTLLDLEEDETAIIVEPPAAPKGATLERTDGAVEISVGGGAWRPAIAGTALEPGAGVRTKEGGVASLSYGNGISAEVQSESNIRIDRLDDEVARFVVGRGLVVIDVDEEVGSDRIVQLAAEGTDAIVETQNGRVAVLSDGEGQVQTAVTRGAATLEANGERVELGAGQQSLVEKGRGPSKPTAIPSSLLLKVKWPTAATSKRRHRITGTANPGALVRVGDRVVAADAQGKFSAIVDLDEGRNRVVVRAVDVAGNSETSESPTIKVDTKAPAHAIETNPDMWKR